jgi:predicted ATPase
MMTSFHVKNYKCLRDVDLALTPIHVVIGQNDTGKTALLEAMLALHRSVQGPLSSAFSGEWIGRELVNEDAEEPWVEFDAAFSWESDQQIKYHLRVEFPEPGQVCRRIDEYMDENGEIYPFPPWSPGHASVAGRANLSETDRRKGETVVSAMGEAHIYRFDPKAMMIPAVSDPNRKFRMDPDGFGLATLLDDLLGYEPERFIRLREEFIGYYPEFRSVRIETEPAQARSYSASGAYQSSRGNGKGIYFETRKGQRIRAQQASDGAIFFLGLLGLIHSPTAPGLLLLEEPERGVYPRRLEQVIHLLHQLEQRSPDEATPQIIMTTHSPFLLSQFKPNQVTLMSREGGHGPVRARALQDAPHIEERLGDNEFYLGELWYNLSEEELFADAR